MGYIIKYPENLKELEEMWEELKYMLGYLANRPEERKKVKDLRPDDVLGSSFVFICGLCLQLGIGIEDAVHSLQESYFPNKKTIENGYEGLICQHCHDSGL